MGLCTSTLPGGGSIRGFIDGVGCCWGGEIKPQTTPSPRQKINKGGLGE